MLTVIDNKNSFHGNIVWIVLKDYRWVFLDFVTFIEIFHGATVFKVFVELDELHMGGEVELEWREKARWIKFEEDVEEGAERWGKPHVASLSFHSLLELRRGLEQGMHGEGIISVSLYLALASTQKKKKRRRKHTLN